MLASVCHRRHNDGDDRTLPVAQVPSCSREESLGPFDESDLDPKDIETVMLQATCSRAKAVKALRDTGADLIEASELSFLLVDHVY
jgi:NACalpha-BTF3-like transcription factor